MLEENIERVLEEIKPYLQATALGLATVAIGAFNDEHIGKVLRLDKHYKPLYIMLVGVGLP